MLSYYFHKDALEEARRVGRTNIPQGLGRSPLAGTHMLAADRHIYDVLPLNGHLVSELEHDPVSRQEQIDRVKSVHFTGGCGKPWLCEGSEENYLCMGLRNRWWNLRS